MVYVAVCELGMPPPEVMEHPLSKDEEASLGRCRFSKRRREVDVSRRLVRYCLHEYLGVTGDAIKWGDTGPCYDDTHCDVRLSIAHSRSHAAVAVSNACAIGIDIETLDTSLRWRRIMDAMFCDEDVEWISRSHSRDETTELKRFMSVWTAREAYAKSRRASVLDQLSRPLLRDARGSWFKGKRATAAAARVEVAVDREWVAAVCRPLSVQTPVSLVGLSRSIGRTDLRRPEFVFNVGETH